MDLRSRTRVTGERRDTETVMRRSERGGWKSAHRGNSLAAYSTGTSGSEERVERRTERLRALPLSYGNAVLRTCCRKALLIHYVAD